MDISNDIQGESVDYDTTIDSYNSKKITNKKIIDGAGKEEKNIAGNSKRSSLVSRNITVFGRRTSVRLEPEMWEALKDISQREKCTIHDICTLVNICKHENTSLTAAIRVFLVLYYRSAATEEGHLLAGHGNFNKMMERAKIPKKKDGKFKDCLKVAGHDKIANTA